ncbi:MAG: 50S ribosomal protein L1 [Planctomycetota bacterium]|nr:MAG: 50S ribosomal protein L1 [Planctomycetota bacterium]
MAKSKAKEKNPGEASSRSPLVAPAGDVTVSTPAPVAEGVVAKKRGRQPGHPPRRGKKLRNLLANLKTRMAKEGQQPLKKAITLLKQVKRAKFNETVEVHMSLGVDTTQADQLIRGSVALPHGIGKSVRVAIFCQGENQTIARKAGADFVGGDELIKKVQDENWMDFDVALATQDMMAKVIRLGKVLGPRGLMPTPKAGTVVPTGGDVAAAVKDFKAGKVEYRTDKGGNIHAGVGKIDFEDDKLAENITVFVNQIRNAKPVGVRGNYVLSITVAGTMTPGIPVSV